jgi:hypothetical protein
MPRPSRGVEPQLTGAGYPLPYPRCRPVLAIPALSASLGGPTGALQELPQRAAPDLPKGRLVERVGRCLEAPGIRPLVWPLCPRTGIL